MLKACAAFLFSFLAFCSFAAEADLNDDGAQTVNSTISEVTVYSDRARVQRTTSVELTGQVSRVAFRKLPGWVDDGSMRVSISPPDAGQILGVEVKKTFLARPDEVEFSKVQAAVREISDQISSLDDEKSVLDAQAKQIDAIRAFSMEKFPKDAAAREIKPAEYGQVVEFVADSLRKLAKARRELDLKRRDMQPELAARQRKLNELQQRSQLEQRDIIVEVKGNAAARATLTIAYLIPGATWEPVHDLRASTQGSVTLASYAVVSQTTGEDWTGAALSLSTQSTTQTMKVPDVEALLVGGGRTLARAISPGEDTFARAQENLSRQFRLFNEISNKAPVQAAINDNFLAQCETQQRIEVIFKALQQRGTTAHFQAAGAQTVRTDGRPIRVPIGSVTLESRRKIVAAPEASLNAAHAVELSNSGTQPILPGKVSLYMEGAFLGTTEVDFVAQGETFAMFLGVADRIKLQRTLDSKHSSHFSDGKRTRLQVAYLVTVENLSDKEVSMQLTDRVPVSEIEDVRIRNVKVLPDCKPDDKGLLRWDLALGAKGTREFRLEYTLEYSSDLAARAMAKPPAKSSMPAPKERTIESEILILEKAIRK